MTRTISIQTAGAVMATRVLGAACATASPAHKLGNERPTFVSDEDQLLPVGVLELPVI